MLYLPATVCSTVTEELLPIQDCLLLSVKFKLDSMHALIDLDNLEHDC